MLGRSEVNPATNTSKHLKIKMMNDLKVSKCRPMIQNNKNNDNSQSVNLQNTIVFFYLLKCESASIHQNTPLP